MSTETDTETLCRNVFISYSTSDRPRVDGLVRLLELFGHKVFIDYRSIRLGRRWEDEIDRALEETDVMLVFWTRAASLSRWVKREYEHVLAHDPSCPVVPVIGDETPLTARLAERQALTFFPVINELLEIKREMAARDCSRTEIERKISERLKEAGVSVEPSDRKRIFRFFGLSGWLAWVSSPLALLDWGWRQLFDAAAQLSPAQAVLALGTATLAVTTVSHVDREAVARAEALAADRAEKIELLAATNDELSEKIKTEEAEQDKLIDELVKQKTVFESTINEVMQALAENPLLQLVNSNVLIDVESGPSELVLKVVDTVDTNDAGHVFSALIPSGHGFRTFIPPGSYKAYYAFADLSEDLKTLIPEEADRDVINLDLTEHVGRIHKIHRTKVDAGAQRMPLHNWGNGKTEQKDRRHGADSGKDVE